MASGSTLNCANYPQQNSKNGIGVYIYSHVIYFRGADPVSKLKYGLPDDRWECPAFLRCERQKADEELLYIKSFTSSQWCSKHEK